jgi:hypothetical protein
MGLPRMIPLSIPSASRARTARPASSAAAPVPVHPDSVFITNNTLFNIVVIIAIERCRCKEEIQGSRKTVRTKIRTERGWKRGKNREKDKEKDRERIGEKTEPEMEKARKNGRKRSWNSLLKNCSYFIKCFLNSFSFSVHF